jgi:hypothetical protein
VRARGSGGVASGEQISIADGTPINDGKLSNSLLEVARNDLFGSSYTRQRRLNSPYEFITASLNSFEIREALWA